MVRGAATRAPRYALFCALLACGARSELSFGEVASLDDGGAHDARVEDPDARVADTSLPDDTTPLDGGSFDAISIDAFKFDAPFFDVIEEEVVHDAPADAPPPPRDGAVVDTGFDCGATPEDAGCDPFTITSQNVIPPVVSAAGPLYYSLESTGCGCGAVPARSCNGTAILSPGITAEEEVAILVDAMNGECGAGSAGFTAKQNSFTPSELDLADPMCAGLDSNGGGLSLLIASADSTLQDGGFLGDFENELVQNGCAGLVGGSFSMIAGTATGIAIQSNPTVLFDVTAGIYQANSATGVDTAPGMTAAAIVSTALAGIRGSILIDNAKCSSDPFVATLVTCEETELAGSVSLTGSFTVNDTGIGRVLAAGPPESMSAATDIIRAAGGLPDVLSLNFVGGQTCAPCEDAGMAVCCR